MALKPGFENKRQVYLLSALAAIIVIALVAAALIYFERRSTAATQPRRGKLSALQPLEKP